MGCLVKGALVVAVLVVTSPFLFGAAYIVSSTALGPVIGGATFLALIVAGQMLSALLIDHYGWIGFPVREVSSLRLTGAAFVVVGVVLLARG